MIRKHITATQEIPYHFMSRQTPWSARFICWVARKCLLEFRPSTNLGMRVFLTAHKPVLERYRQWQRQHILQELHRQEGNDISD